MIFKKNLNEFFKKKLTRETVGKHHKNSSDTGAEIGGGRGVAYPPSWIRPPVDPKGPPFDNFSEIHFWPTDPKIFLKAPSALIYTNFEGERAPKKTQFFCQKFSKSAQKQLF